VRLSRSKGRAIAERYPGQPVLAADTVVVLEDEILGKPSGPAQAVEMLTALRGRRHSVFTAVSLLRSDGFTGNLEPAGSPQVDTRLSCSHVWIRNFSEREIRDYVATGDPLDKAGAYAIQHPVYAPVDRWDGCYTAIMGLPLRAVGALLLEAGLAPASLDVIAVCERQSGRCCLRGGQTGCSDQG
jgi:septum formation protein